MDVFSNSLFATMESFKIADSDETDPNNTYYGFYIIGVGFNIMNIVTSGTIKSYRYYVSNDPTQYTTAWAGKSGLTYDYYKGV